MELTFIPYDYDHLDLENRDIIRIFGRSIDGKTICFLDQVNNYFYVTSDKIKKIKSELEKQKIKSEILDKNYLSNKVKALKVYINERKVKETTEKIKLIDANVKLLELDINPITKYIITKKFKPLFQ